MISWGNTPEIVAKRTQLEANRKPGDDGAVYDKWDASDEEDTDEDEDEDENRIIREYFDFDGQTKVAVGGVFVEDQMIMTTQARWQWRPAIFYLL